MATEDPPQAGESSTGERDRRDGPVDVEWSDGRRVPVGWPTLLAAAGLAAIAAAFAYDYAVVGDGTLAFGYDVGRLEWLWLACLWVDAVYVAGAVVRDPRRSLGGLRRLTGRPLGLAGAAVAAAILIVGTLAPLFLAQPEPNFVNRNQPPVFTSISMDHVNSCVRTVGDRCVGTWEYPLGNTNSGKDMLTMLAFGARTVVQLAVVAVTMTVPLATVAGTVAAYAGGRVDRAITTVAETLRTVPALLVFLVWRWAAADGSLFALVLAFGLVNWGNVAVVVRSRALTEVSKDYVTAAEASGASTLEVVSDHLVPNVARTAISSAVYQVPLFVTVEATLSFLQFGNPPSPLLTTPPTQESWGRMIGWNVEFVDPFWWGVAVPVAALLLTILSLNLTADALQDVLNPGQ
jgi:peptide/nickel transport system permease protein